MSVIDLACASGLDYMPHCSAMLHSALSNVEGQTVRVHYLHGPDVPQGGIDAVTAMVERAGASISFFSMPDAMIDGLPITQHFNRAMWYRIHLPELLPDVDKVLYLDADTIVLDSLVALWETPMNDNYVAAVTNVFGPWDVDYPAKLGMTSPANYFNSGVILMDLAAMRRDRCTAALRTFALEHPQLIWFPDQDAMNVLLEHKRLALHPRWNCMNSLFEFPAADEIFGREQAEEARGRPAIRHFEGGGANKPWHYLCHHPMREAYFEHRRGTPWPKVKLEGMTPANVIRRLRRGARSPRPSGASV